ncbi:hypothetical protein GCM10009648_37790 [Tsukamurella spumae]
MDLTTDKFFATFACVNSGSPADTSTRPQASRIPVSDLRSRSGQNTTPSGAPREATQPLANNIHEITSSQDTLPTVFHRESPGHAEIARHADPTRPAPSETAPGPLSDGGDETLEKVAGALHHGVVLAG